MSSAGTNDEHHRASGPVEAAAAAHKTAARPLRAEVELGERVAELSRINVELQEARRAALNLMEEAVEGRRVVEDLNRQLQNEIAERQRAAEALRRQKDQFTTLVEHIPDIVARLDRDLRYLYISPAVEAMTGMKPEGFIGKPRTNKGVAPEFAREREQLSRKVFETGLEQYLEFPIESPFGTRNLEMRLVPEFAPDGSVESLMTLTRDVTERKRSEQALRDSELRHRQLADTVPILVWSCGPDGSNDFFNSRWFDYTGLSLEQSSGEAWLQAVHPDDQPRVLERWTESLRSGAPYAAEFRLRRADGQYRWCLSQGLPMRDDQGSITRWYGSCTDVEDMKQAEQALREADRRKNEFLAMLAHELRNPLAPIRNSLHILRLSGSDSGAAERVHEMMERQVNHLVRLVDDLMEVSRITRGKIELRKEPVELAAVIRSAVETSKPLLDAARHQLAITLSTEPLILEADPVRLAQVLANLLNNAAKYTNEGGQIWLTARPEGSTAVVSVRDNGIGIPVDMLPKIFDPFTQVERTGIRAQGGLGIGLTLVRNLVELHNGNIEVKSEGPGKGSEFVVRLPLAEGRLGVKDQPQRVERPASVSPHRVLVVDDNCDVADSLVMLLKFLGAEVYTASNGPAALEALKFYQPSVLLVDIGMPGMDGYEVARRARLQAAQEITLIALTGWSQEEYHHRSKEAGFDHHLVKPVDLDTLQALLASLPKQSTGPVGVLD